MPWRERQFQTMLFKIGSRSHVKNFAILVNIKHLCQLSLKLKQTRKKEKTDLTVIY